MGTLFLLNKDVNSMAYLILLACFRINARRDIPEFALKQLSNIEKSSPKVCNAYVIYNGKSKFSFMYYISIGIVSILLLYVIYLNTS